MAEGEGMSDAVPDPEIDALREEILRAALPHVPFDGWTMATLSAGARAAGMDPADAVRAFPRGPVEAIAFHSRLADLRMVEEIERRDLAVLKIRERIAAAVRIRLEQNDADRGAVRPGLPLPSMPQSGPTAAKLLYRTVDATWCTYGATAYDSTVYPRRVHRTGNHSATLHNR